MHFIGYLAAVVVGILLGLTGGGGSVLTVPVLVYLFNVSPVTATSYSLFIVGTTSFVGAIKNSQTKNIDIQTALLFGTPAISIILCIRQYLLPAIPEHIGSFYQVEITKTFITMILLAVLLLCTSKFVLNKNYDFQLPIQPSLFKLLFMGMLVGLIIGMLGVGGGFLITPSLITIVRLPMKKAIGTSLLIISISSISGFIGDPLHKDINWFILFTITVLSVIGFFIGNSISSRISGTFLKKAFGWFLFILGGSILVKEVLSHLYFPKLSLKSYTVFLDDIHT